MKAAIDRPGEGARGRYGPVAESSDCFTCPCDASGTGTGFRLSAVAGVIGSAPRRSGNAPSDRNGNDIPVFGIVPVWSLCPVCQTSLPLYTSVHGNSPDLSYVFYPV
jgi:hypothetical protein